MSNQRADTHRLTSNHWLEVFLKKCGEALGVATIDRVVERFHEWLPQQPEFNVFFSRQDIAAGSDG